MINEILTNLAYLFYPQDICAWEEKEKYLQSEEYKNLKRWIEIFDSDKGELLRHNFKMEFDKDLILKNFEDFSKLDWQDRCFKFNLTLIEDGELQSINLYLSILLPYYIIRSRKHKTELFFSESKIKEIENNNLSTRKIKDLIINIKEIVETKLLYKEFPEELICHVIKDISFQDSRLGFFTMFNAFFNNEIIYEINN